MTNPKIDVGASDSTEPRSEVRAGQSGITVHTIHTGAAYFSPQGLYDDRCDKTIDSDDSDSLRNAFVAELFG